MRCAVHSAELSAVGGRSGSAFARFRSSLFVWAAAVSDNLPEQPRKVVSLDIGIRKSQSSVQSRCQKAEAVAEFSIKLKR
jgi:hypothetical protein